MIKLWGTQDESNLTRKKRGVKNTYSQFLFLLTDKPREDQGLSKGMDYENTSIHLTRAEHSGRKL